MTTLPEPIATQLAREVKESGAVRGIHDMAGVLRVQHRFVQVYAAAALLAGLGLAAWIVLSMPVRIKAWHIAAVCVALVAELLWFAWGYNPQCDPALYYPRIPVLEAVAKDEPGRVIGYHCLPANLALTHGLSDIRGYDGVDAARLVELAELKWMGNNIVSDPRSPAPEYAALQWMVPLTFKGPDGRLRLHPVLDMLGVRYVIFRGSLADVPPPFSGNDYWAVVNPRALPRAFVPERVQVIADDGQRLLRLAAPDFDARKIAFIESEVPEGLPGACRGAVSITKDLPKEVTLAVNMQTSGLVVLADLWDKGWNAYLDGRRTPVLRTNHALRGVVTPGGAHTLQFRYEPAGLARGLWLLGFAAAAWLAWVAGVVWAARKPRPIPGGVRVPPSDGPRPGDVVRKTLPIRQTTAIPSRPNDGR